MIGHGFYRAQLRTHRPPTIPRRSRGATLIPSARTERAQELCASSVSARIGERRRIASSGAVPIAAASASPLRRKNGCA